MPSSTRPDALININTAAERLGTTPGHIRRLIHHKQIPYIKIGALIRFNPDTLNQWVTNNTHGDAA